MQAQFAFWTPGHMQTATAYVFGCSSHGFAGHGTWTDPAASFFRASRAAYDRSGIDCESITFADAIGRNVHCSFPGDHLATGADLPANGCLRLRAVARDQATASLEDFCSRPQSLIFGCAELRSLLDSPLAIARDALAGFMFGEVVTIAGRPQFGNLMASRLTHVDR